MAPTMDTYVLVRPLPRVGASTEDEVKALAERSNAAIRECHEHGEHIKWLASHIADDVVVCVYNTRRLARRCFGCAPPRHARPVFAA